MFTGALGGRRLRRDRRQVLDVVNCVKRMYGPPARWAHLPVNSLWGDPRSRPPGWLIVKWDRVRNTRNHTASSFIVGDGYGCALIRSASFLHPVRVAPAGNEGQEPSYHPATP